MLILFLPPAPRSLDDGGVWYTYGTSGSSPSFDRMHSVNVLQTFGTVKNDTSA